MSELHIAGRRIADDEPCYMVAEIGSNHGGSVKTACLMIVAAATAGASAVKLQKRHVPSLYTPAMLHQPYENENSFGKTYGEHRLALEFGGKQFRACQAAAEVFKIPLFATAFDEKSADFLMDVCVPAIKIHSGGLTDLPLLKHVAAFQVPMILSTGGADEQDIDRAIQTVTTYHTRLAVLHCTAAYPVLDYTQLNLRCILALRHRYPDLVVGYSGHDVGIAMSLVAYAFGARIIEKHFTLNRASKGTDHSFSLEPVGLKKLCRDLERAHVALGDGVKRIYETEFGPLSKMRRWFIEGKWQIGTAAEQEPKVHA